MVLVDTSFSVSGPGQAVEARALARAASTRFPPGNLWRWWRSTTSRGWSRSPPASAGRRMPRSTGLSPRPRGHPLPRGAGRRLGADRGPAGTGGGGDRPAGRRLGARERLSLAACRGGDPPGGGAGREPRRRRQSIGNRRRPPSGCGGGGPPSATPGSRSRWTAWCWTTACSGWSPANRRSGFPVTLPDSGVVTAVISDPRGYPADDRRYRRLNPADAAGVLLVTEDRVREIYLERALASTGADAGAVATVAAADLGRRPDLLAGAAVVVLAGARGLGRAGRGRLSAFVRGGGGLLAVGGPAAAAAARAGLLGAGAEPGPEAARITPSRCRGALGPASSGGPRPGGAGRPARRVAVRGDGGNQRLGRHRGAVVHRRRAGPRRPGPSTPAASSSSPPTCATRATTCPGGRSSCRSCTKW